MHCPLNEETTIQGAAEIFGGPIDISESIIDLYIPFGMQVEQVNTHQLSIIFRF